VITFDDVQFQNFVVSAALCVYNITAFIVVTLTFNVTVTTLKVVV